MKKIILKLSLAVFLFFTSLMGMAQLIVLDDQSTASQSINSCGESKEFEVKVTNNDLAPKNILVTIQVKNGMRIDTAYNGNITNGYQLVSANVDRTKVTYRIFGVANGFPEFLRYEISATCSSITSSGSQLITTDSVFAVNANLSTDIATPIKITNYTVQSSVVDFTSPQLTQPTKC